MPDSLWVRTRRPYDPTTPCPPAWRGTRTIDGVDYVMGGLPALRVAAERIRTAPAVAFDVETPGLDVADRARPKAVTFSDGKTALLCDPRDEEQRALAQEIIARAPALIAHNAMYDVSVLKEAGIVSSPEYVEKITDTLVAARLVRTRQHQAVTLTDCVADHLGGDRQAITEALAALGISTADWYRHGDIDLPDYAVGAMADTAVLPGLATALRRRAGEFLTSSVIGNGGEADDPLRHWIPDEAQVQHIWDREQTVNRVFLRQCHHGLGVDETVVARYEEQAREQIAADEALLREAGVIKDGKHRGHRVTAHLVETGKVAADGAPTVKNATETNPERYAAGKTFLSKYDDDPVVAAHLRVAAYRKTGATYMRGTLDARGTDGRVRTDVHVLGAITGRTSYRSPALQQFDAAARPAILADTDPDGWVSIDVKAMEPVVLALAAGEMDYAALIETGGDAYLPLARLAGFVPEDVPDAEAAEHPGRKKAKTLFLGLMYGMGDAKLAESLGMDPDSTKDRREAARLRATILAAIPKIENLLGTAAACGTTYGEVLTVSGRRIPVAYGSGYAAQNYLAQGSAYDLLAEAIAECHAAGLADHIRLAVHDELVVDASVADQVTDIMARATRHMVRVNPEAAARRLVLDNHSLPHHWKKV
ncbi:hypothetical protein HMPREF2860_01370 [Corynebacterium sp. HMSC064E10]|uniref:DNA polymerase n=1 Tax=Corynebacterium sp. HMSC064E10 TaxID=1739364 RepID=UPI0008A36E7E|nr:DNA polymerase [Corynebacterium sp. HMSC064E10]OFR93336.1 hypothetical protein HMPREF2860_01370 [Corynebacterium sp. HMSC064E10]